MQCTHTPDLREAQNAYESLSFALRAAAEEGSPEKGALEAKAKQARGVLLAAAARLAKVEEHAQVRRRDETRRAVCWYGLIDTTDHKRRWHVSKSHNGHHQGVSQKGRVHQRVADRLLELCQLNLGCYIKSAFCPLLSFSAAPPMQFAR